MSDWLASADYDSWRTSDVDREAMADWRDWRRNEYIPEEEGDFTEDESFGATPVDPAGSWANPNPDEGDYPVPF